MTLQSTCLYALRFVLLSYKPVRTSELTIPIKQMVTDARTAVLVLEETPLASLEALLTCERLVVRNCLSALENVLEVWPDWQDFDMREFEEGIGPFPQLSDIKTAVEWISGVGVIA